MRCRETETAKTARNEVHTVVDDNADDICLLYLHDNAPAVRRALGARATK